MANEQQQSQQLTIEKYAANVSTQTTTWIQDSISKGMISTPEGYDVGTEISSAMLQISQTKDLNNKPALMVCTRESIMSSLRDMAIQGLSMVRKQCYPIVYGNQLQIQRSYFGTIAVFSRMFPNLKVTANVLHEGDRFEYLYNERYDYHYINLIEASFENKDKPLKGAYGFVTDVTTGERVYGCVMTKKEIDACWAKSKSKSHSVHNEFPEEMAKRTLFNRMCKLYVNAGGVIEDSSLADAYIRTTENEYDEEREPSQEEIKVQREIRGKSKGAEGLNVLLGSKKRAEEAEAKEPEPEPVSEAPKKPVEPPIEEKQETIPTQEESKPETQFLAPSDNPEGQEGLFDDEELPEDDYDGYGDIPY